MRSHFVLQEIWIGLRRNLTMTIAYDPRDIQDKWQARWAEIEPFRASDAPDDPRERFYLVDMFPLPVGRPAHGACGGVRHR